MSAKSKIIKRLATGSTSAVNTKAGPKPLAMSAYRSMTDKQRANEKSDAFKAYDKDQITYKEYETIVERVDAANAAESQKMTTKMQQGAADKRAAKPTLSEMSEGTPDSSYNKGGMAKKKKKKGAMYKDGGMPMVMKNGKKVPAFAADGVGKMMKGGMAKKKKAKSNYAYGGMTTSKPRTGNTDYRMGGMFMKNGKK